MVEHLTTDETADPPASERDTVLAYATKQATHLCTQAELTRIWDEN